MKTKVARTAAFKRFIRDQAELGRFFLNVSDTVRGFDRLMEIIGALVQSTGNKSEDEMRSELESVRLHPAFHEYDRLMWELVLCRAVDGFLIYLADLMTMIFRLRPETMKSAETVQVELVLQSQTMDELVGVLADKKVNDLAYKGLRQLSSYIDERFGLTLFGSDAELARAAGIVEVRNLIVHNRGVINHTFLQRVRGQHEQLGDKVSIEAEPLFADLSFLVDSATDLDDKAAQKFGLPKGPT